MAEKLYRLFCEICNWKLVTNGTDEAARKLVEIKTSPIPTGYPKMNEETNKVVVPPPLKQVKRFKCPGCGRGLRPVQVEDVNARIAEQIAIKKRVEERNEEDWAIGRKESLERRKIQRLAPPGVSQEIREGDSQVPE